MKPPFLFSLLLLLSLQSHLAAQNLYGFVLEQNSGKKPVPGVLIKSTFGANQVTTTTKGDFTLTFQDGRPGKSVVLAVEKNNWVITDKSALQTNLPEDPLHHPHTIILCKKAVWEQQNKDFKTLLETYVRKSYEKEKALVNKLDKQYQYIIDSLQEKFTRLEQELGGLAEIYSNTNLDDLSDIERKAYLLFKNGKIDECIALRKSMESEKNFLKARNKEKQLDSLTKQIDTAKQLNKNEIDIHRRNLEEEARLAQLTNDYKTADEKLGFLADNDSTDFNAILRYAAFLQVQNQRERAIIYYSKATALVQSDIDETLVGVNLGALYYRNGNNAKAKSVYEKALKKYKSVTLENASDSFLLAIGLNNLGLLYVREVQYTEAESALSGAIDIYDKLSRAYPARNDYKSEKAGTLVNISILHGKKDHAVAEKDLLTALAINRSLIKNASGYEPALAETLSNLGYFYKEVDSLNKAEKYFIESISLYKDEASSNPARFQPLLADAIDNLGKVYQLNDKAEEAENTFVEALKIRDALAKKQPEIFNVDLAETLTNLGILYTNTKHFEPAETALLEALNVYKQMSALDSIVYAPDLSDGYNNLAQFYRNLEKYDKAEAASLKSLAIRLEMAKRNPLVYELDVADQLRNLGAIAYIVEKYPDAEQYFSGAFDLYKKYLSINPKTMEIDFCYVVEMMGFISDEPLNYRTINTYLTNSAKVDSILANYPDDNVYKQSKLSQNSKFKTSPNFTANLLRSKRDEAATYTEKLTLSQQILEIDKKLAETGEKKYSFVVANDKGSLAWFLLFNKKFADAEAIATDALQPSYFSQAIEWVNTNLALAYLFQGKYNQAEKIYRELKDKPYGNDTYKSTFLSDLDELEKAGVTHKDVQKIRALLKQ